MSEKILWIAGIGMGNHNLMTEEVKNVIMSSELVCGASRIGNAAKQLGYEGEIVNAYLFKDIRPLMAKYNSIAVLMSGDTGFCSGAKKLAEEVKSDEALSDWTVKLAPGISSISYLASKIQISYEDAFIVSLHGKEKNVWAPLIVDSVLYNKKTFALSNGYEQLVEIMALFQEYHVSADITVGYQFSYEEELIERVTDLETLPKEGLYTLYFENKNPLVRRVAYGIRDEEFTRGKVPMTKQEVRHLSVDMLELKQDSVLYDIGCGTGSVGIEAAIANPLVQVYSFDKNPEAVELTKANARDFHAANVFVSEGDALELVKSNSLPVPTHAFIGGSGGELKDLVGALRAMNPEVCIVSNAVTLETLGELTELMTEHSEMITVNISRTRAVGSYHMLNAENPITIVKL